MGNRAPRQDFIMPVTAAWLWQAKSAQKFLGQPVHFRHFQFKSALTLDKCRQLGVSPYFSALLERTVGSVPFYHELRRSLFLIVLMNDISIHEDTVHIAP